MRSSRNNRSCRLTISLAVHITPGDAVGAQSLPGAGCQMDRVVHVFRSSYSAVTGCSEETGVSERACGEKTQLDPP